MKKIITLIKSFFIINSKKLLTTAGIFAAFLTTDIISKRIIESSLKYEGNKIDILFGSFIQFRLIYNRGGVFGIGQGNQTIFLILSCIVLIVLVSFYCYEIKNNTLFFSIPMGLIFSGAAGNILDRIPHLFGVSGARDGVVDFIYIGVDGVYRWPAFNVADSAIVIGAVLLIIIFWKHEKALKAQKKAEEAKTD